MIQLSPLGQNDASSPCKAPRLPAWLLKNRQIRVIAAAFMFAGFAGNLSLTTAAFAQQQSPADCAAKCDADEKQCLDNQSSEELCDYDKKMCKKACAQQ